MEIKDRLYIGGEWVAPAGTNTIEVISPTTEEVIARVPEASEGDVDRAVEAAKAALAGPYPLITPDERADYLVKLSQAIQARSQELAEVIVAVGLAQNIAAVRVLASEGVQRGHMSLHAKNIAAAAGATGDEVAKVVEALSPIEAAGAERSRRHRLPRRGAGTRRRNGAASSPPSTRRRRRGSTRSAPSPRQAI